LVGAARVPVPGHRPGDAARLQGRLLPRPVSPLTSAVVDAGPRSRHAAVAGACGLRGRAGSPGIGDVDAAAVTTGVVPADRRAVAVASGFLPRRPRPHRGGPVTRCAARAGRGTGAVDGGGPDRLVDEWFR